MLALACFSTKLQPSPPLHKSKQNIATTQYLQKLLANNKELLRLMKYAKTNFSFARIQFLIAFQTK
jgi:hypothetical protein